MLADDIIRELNLSPHPEGGWFRETWRASSPPGERAGGTAIYFLLKAGESSAWHRVDAAEMWHFYAGDPLLLTISDTETTPPRSVILGTSLQAGERPQVLVPANSWQAARPLGDFTLVGCTVSPGFEFAGFEMAPAGWAPG